MPMIELTSKKPVKELKLRKSLSRKFKVHDSTILSLISSHPSLIELEVTKESWFSDVQFYIYGLVYMGSKMLVNISAAMMQFYLIYVMKVGDPELTVQNTPIELAIFPMIVFTSSVITSSSIGQLYL